MGKLICKTGLLLAMVSVILLCLSPFFTPKWVEGHADNGATYMTTTTNGFFALEEDSLDVLFIGSSQVLRGISPVQLEEEYGLRAYSRATTVQSAPVSYYYLRNALKTQHPSIVVVEPSALYTQYDADEREGYVHYAFDNMPLDLDKCAAAYRTIRGSEDQHLLDYVFPAVYYHGRWSELEDFDWSYPLSEDKTDPNRGAILLDDAAPQDFVPLTGTAAAAEPYAEESRIWYEKMVELCQAQGIQFVMLRTPRMDWSEERHTADAAFADQYGVPLFDFNLEALYTETGLDGQTDFYDRNHMNTFGAGKLTHRLGELLMSLYDA